MKFNEKLKVLREKKGFTQEEMATKLNIARQSVSKWEMGINEPDFDTLKKLCQILDCSIADLIDDDGEVVSSADAKKKKTFNWLFNAAAMIAIITVLIIIYFVRIAPDQVIKHWDSDGNIEMGSKWYLLLNLLTPVIVFAALAFGRFIMGHSTNEYSKRTMIAYGIMFVIIQVFVLAFSIVMSIIMIGTDNIDVNMYSSMIVAIVLSVIIAIAPFSHPRWNKRNAVFGFRSNFTLSSEEAWNKINAFTSIALLVGGIISYVVLLILANKEYGFASFAILFVAIIVIIIYHEVIRNRSKKKL